MKDTENGSITRASLRQHYREQRHSLSQLQQNHAADQLAKQRHNLIESCNCITSYIASDGEICPSKLVVKLNPGKVYLPVVNAQEQMQFALSGPEIPLIEGRWGIHHPLLQASEVLNQLAALDAMLIPLVAFDRSGARLGRGGGFYDRILATLPNSVMRIGVAHHFQERTKLPTESWDQSLDFVITDKETIDCRIRQSGT